MAVPEPTVSVAVPEASPRFSAGAVISRGISVWVSNLPLFLGISVAFHLSLLVVRAVLWQPSWVRPVASVAGFILLAFLVSGAIVRGVVSELGGGRASLAECLATVVRSFPTILGTSLAAGAAVLVGSIFLVIPGLMAACSYFVALPVAVVEKEPVFKCLARSSELTGGSRWHVFGLLLVIRVLALAVTQLAAIA